MLTIGQPVAPPPASTAIVDKQGNLTPPWIQWLTSIWDAVAGPAHTTAPATSAANGYAGQLAYDQNFLYVYVGSAWKRIPLNNF